MRIDIVSDYVCPWCYIGVTRLFKVMRASGRPTLAAVDEPCWHPFLLNPATPPQGEPYPEFMRNKFGSDDAVEALHRRVREAGEQEGIAFDFERMRVRPSTRAAHALVDALQRRGAQVGRLALGLFGAHFLRGLNIGEPAVLAQLAGEAGIGAGDVAAALGAPVDGELDAMARALGIGGVPVFLFDWRVAVSGAQPPDVLAAAMRGLG